jgi:hypothetical protein
LLNLSIAAPRHAALDPQIPTSVKQTYFMSATIDSIGKLPNDCGYLNRLRQMASLARHEALVLLRTANNAPLSTK